MVKLSPEVAKRYPHLVEMVEATNELQAITPTWNLVRYHRVRKRWKRANALHEAQVAAEDTAARAAASGGPRSYFDIVRSLTNDPKILKAVDEAEREVGRE